MEKIKKYNLLLDELYYLCHNAVITKYLDNMHFIMLQSCYRTSHHIRECNNENKNMSRFVFIFLEIGMLAVRDSKKPLGHRVTDTDPVTQPWFSGEQGTCGP